RDSVGHRTGRCRTVAQRRRDGQTASADAGLAMGWFHLHHWRLYARPNCPRDRSAIARPGACGGRPIGEWPDPCRRGRLLRGRRLEIRGRDCTSDRAHLARWAHGTILGAYRRLLLRKSCAAFAERKATNWAAT